MIGTIMVGERLLRDHPGPPGADPREGGGPRARSALERARQAAVGAQQLPDAAGRLRDALEPLPVHLRARACVADPRRADGDRRVGPPLLQPAPRGPKRLVDPRERSLAIVVLALLIRAEQHVSQALRPAADVCSRCRRSCRRRCAPCHSMTPTEPGYSRAAGRDSLRHGRRDRSAGVADRGYGRPDADAMPLGNVDPHDAAARARRPLARWLASLVQIKLLRSHRARRRSTSAASSKLASSSGEWLIPSRQGRNTIALGTNGATHIVSCAAPDDITEYGSPPSAAAPLERAADRESSGVAGTRWRSTTSAVVP